MCVLYIVGPVVEYTLLLYVTVQAMGFESDTFCRGKNADCWEH